MAYTSESFDYTRDFKSINFREHPELYQVGRGEQGVLMVEPYKSEILPFWRFKTPEDARVSADKIYELFLNYKKNGDFVGMDMARKFLQMGYTRARRYANHKGGWKYVSNPQREATKEDEKLARKNVRPYLVDEEKAKSAAIFYEVYVRAREDEDYQRMKRQHQVVYEKRVEE